MKYRIVSLMDNRSIEGFEHEHGLSIYLESEGARILFDTGMTGKFIGNAEKLGIDICSLDIVVLSHGHYDHSGGLESLIDGVGSQFELLVGEGFFDGKYKCAADGKEEYIGNPFSEDDLCKSGINVKVVSEDMIYIADDLILFRHFDHIQDFEKLNPKFTKSVGDNRVLDEFKDELSLGIKTEKGIFLILGCSHPGFVNILETVKARTGENICGVMGGTHLVNADNYWIEEVVSYIEDSGIDMVATSHCTGEIAEKKLMKRLKKKFREVRAGEEL